MKLKICAFIVLMLSICSAYVSAVILSSDTLNVEPTIASTQETHIVLQKPHIAQESDVNNDKSSDFHINQEQISLNEEETTKESDKSEQDVTLNELDIPKTETQLPQPIVEENTHHGQDTSGEKISDDHNIAPNVPASVPITVEDASKDILVEAPIVGDIENVLVDNKNDSNALQKPSLPVTTLSNEDESIRQSEPSEPAIEATKLSANKTNSDSDNSTTVEKDELNLTEENQIPVFSEWAQKRLEEVEKEVEQEAVNTSTMKKNAPAANKQPVLKLKNLKNYASPDCGAKIIAANSESSGIGYVLTSTRDEYLLSPCKSRIWFVVELCEAIQAERIDLANYELFSSSPKNFSVAVSSRFPTRDWSNVGRFVAKDERYIQSFDLFPHLFGKYVRVDVHSHYNSEHFCPISLFRVYGTSEFEAFETENRQHPIDDIDDDVDDDQESDTNKSKTNIFKSASDAVMSIVDTVKKAASFVKPNGNKTTDNNSQISSGQNLSNDKCVSPNHAIYCENCSDGTAREVTALIECKQNLLKRLLDISIIRNTLYKSQICNTLIGLDLNINCSDPVDINSTTSKQLTNLQNYIIHLFSSKYLTAMCNLLAASDRNIVWNSTISLGSEPPINITIDRKADDSLLQGEQSIKATSSAPPTQQIDQVIKSTPPEDNVEDKLPPEQQSPSTSADSSENMSQEALESNENTVEQSESEVMETSTPLPEVDSSEEIIDKGQNIFNVVDSAETSTESQNVMVVETPPTEVTTTITTTTTTTATTATTAVNIEQESLPSVIILPETTTPTPNNELNDASEEQGANGWTNAPQFGQKLHSESVFLRLSNRVKALERNMSLSGQYLEELSRRYKKQVEELQMSFAKTLVNIEEQSRRNLERKQELFEQNQKLRNDLDILTERIFSWRNIIICGACFTCVQVLIFHLILKIWGQKYGLNCNGSTKMSGDLQPSDETLTRKRKSGNVPVKFRRKSAEEKRERTLSESSSSALQRRPSSEALNISGTYTELLINDAGTTEADYQIGERNNKSTSSESHDISGYVRIEDLKDLYDKPGEQEYEFYGPVLEQRNSRSSSQKNDDCDDVSGGGVGGGGSETTINSSLDSVHSKKSKTLKNKNRNRRLSSPLFFKSPFSSGSAAQSTGWEWHRSKKLQNSSQTNKKSKSESPISHKQNGINNNNNSTPTTNTNNINQKSARNDSTRSSISSSIDDRKSSGSFKRILKKMF